MVGMVGMVGMFHRSYDVQRRGWLHIDRGGGGGIFGEVFYLLL
jgi:hypothetical protein